MEAVGSGSWAGGLAGRGWSSRRASRCVEKDRAALGERGCTRAGVWPHEGTLCGVRANEASGGEGAGSDERVADVEGI